MGIALVYLLLKFIILPLTVRSRDYKFISSYSVQINIMRPQVKTVSMCCLTTAHPHSPQHFHRLFMGLVTICISLLTYDWSVPNGVKVSWGQICLPCCFLVTTKNIFHLCPGKEKNVFERKKKIYHEQQIHFQTTTAQIQTSASVCGKWLYQRTLK